MDKKNTSSFCFRFPVCFNLVGVFNSEQVQYEPETRERLCSLDGDILAHISQEWPLLRAEGSTVCGKSELGEWQGLRVVFC